MLEITLFDSDAAVAGALGAILELPCRTAPFGDLIAASPAVADGVVSPANSFGFLDGGVDLAYAQSFPDGLQERLQGCIRQLPNGEILVGEAVSVATLDERIPWLIAAPTMRTPRLITDYDAVYLATRAAVAKALRLGLQDLLMPAMGTGTGGVEPRAAARLMRAGIADALHPPPFPRSGSATLRRAPGVCLSRLSSKHG